MHFCCLVLLKKSAFKGGLTREKVEHHIAKALAPYDENATLDSHEVVMPPEDVESMVDFYKTLDIKTLAKRMEDWNGGEGFVDKHCNLCYRTTRNDDAKWDWWVVGGRWSGSLTGYDPLTDERNVETCSCCHGTGIRMDLDGKTPWATVDKKGVKHFKDDWAKEMNGCNGCKGTGKAVVWSTSYAPYEGDVQETCNVPPDFRPFALVTPNGKWHEVGSRWKKETEDEEKTKLEEFHKLLKPHLKNTYTVVVDCHI